MLRCFIIPTILILGCFPTSSHDSDETLLQVTVQDKELIGYQAMPLVNPKGGEQFKGSNFIHPLKTPSGFIVTEIQPDDHLHHFGLWWPWKYIEIEGRQVLCWELQDGDGLVQAQNSRLTSDGFTATSVYIDRKASEGPRNLISETLHVKISEIIEHPVTGYSLDLEILHKTAIDIPVTALKYRYSGFAFRGTSKWNRNNSTVLTSECKDYDASNFTRAKWVRVEGSAEEGHTAGVLIMSCPLNYDHPELLRTWDSRSHNGAVFINFNSVQNRSWRFEPGKQYIRRFRVFVYDGTLTFEQADDMRKAYVKSISTNPSSESVFPEEM